MPVLRGDVSVGLGILFPGLYSSRYSRLNDVYVYENLRIVMTYNFSFRTNIQFPTPYYVVHYTWRLYNSCFIAGLLHEKCSPFERNDFQDVVRTFLALTLVKTHLKSAFRICGEIITWLPRHLFSL